MKDRLLLLLQERNLTNAKFAEIMETQPSNITHIMGGRNKPSYDFIVKLMEKFPEINPVWLLTGGGSMYLNVNFTPPSVTDVIEPDLFDEPKAAPIITGEGVVVPSGFGTKSPEAGKVSPREKQASAINSIANDGKAIQLSSVNDKKVEKIVVFYDDKTFMEYLPE